MTTEVDRPRGLARELMSTANRLRSLHDQLAESAEARGLLDVAYRTIDSPVGQLLLAATEEGLVRVAYAAENHDAVLQMLSDRISCRVLRAPARLDQAAREIEEYFAGHRRSFELRLDWRLANGFRSTVLRHLATDVPYGQTASYGTLATLAGSSAAVRAVGTACATNPLPIVVPCHRVIRSNGSPGGYVGGTNVKSALLELEAAA
jgi:methylated-DNA-[protein]-cysteine S-methyltransferase